MFRRPSQAGLAWTKDINICPNVDSLVEYQSAALRQARLKRLPDDEGYAARIPGFNGLIVFGDTETEAIGELESALSGWVELALRQGRGLPALKSDRQLAVSAR